ncbi:uncharacterized protein LOC141719650 [Apium graveolens]|uniref:uncharacterized protein LOC141719650 n=1 Tax=Apium graveolens TaxID=4045 RepID=UPI003D7C0E9B
MVREAQLPARYHNTTSDLRFHGNSDLVKFLGHFNIEMDVYQEAMRYAPSVTTLAYVRQREDESLTSYFKSFNTESTNVRGASDEALKSFLIAGLKVGSDFWKHLQGKDLATMVDVLAQEESFRDVEQSLTKVRPTSQATSIEHIFEVDKNKGLFRKPEALSSWKSKDKKKYCEFHESSRHNTHECRQLKDEIKALIKEGYLGEWVVKEVRRHKNGSDKIKEEGGHTPRGSNSENFEENKFVRDGRIRAIFREDPEMECGYRALARYVREARYKPLTDIHRVETRPPKIFKGESMDITFREADARWVHHPHNDAMVISLQIGTKNVYKAFVDNGSSENIIYYNTYKKWDCLIET